MTRKKLLALVWEAEHFETYLWGKQFIVRTDHNTGLSDFKFK